MYMKYWIIVANKEHTLGLSEGFVQTIEKVHWLVSLLTQCPLVHH